MTPEKRRDPADALSRRTGAAAAAGISNALARNAASRGGGASPAGKLLERIRLPEVCGSITFPGPKRNRLFMAASQSLYAVSRDPRARPACGGLELAPV